MAETPAIKFTYILEEVEGRVKGLSSLESKGDRDLTKEEQVGALRLTIKAIRDLLSSLGHPNG